MQARLRAQLGDRSKYSGERRRRSVVVVSMVLTITDPLRGSYPLFIPPFVQSPSCAHSLLRSFIRLHGVNHNQPFPTATSHKIFTSFSICYCFSAFSPLWFNIFDFNCKRQFINALETCRRHVPTLWCLRYGVVEFVDFFCEWCTLLYNIKEAGSFCGGTCFVGVCVWATPYLVACL